MTTPFLFVTPLGWLALTGDERGFVTRLHLAYPSRESLLHAYREEFGHDVECAKNATPLPWLERLGERIVAYLAGTTRDTFCDVDIDFGDATPFQRAVWEACRGVLPGERLTYAELASRAGFPRAARAVGSAMAANRVPLIVPCHRIVRSDGQIGAFSAPGGPKTKSWLLAMEATMEARNESQRSGRFTS